MRVYEVGRVSRHSIIIHKHKIINFGASMRSRASPCESVRVRAGPCGSVQSVRVRAGPCESVRGAKQVHACVQRFAESCLVWDALGVCGRGAFA